MVRGLNGIQEITWQGIDKAVDELCEYFEPSMFDAVFGIANGGIIPAALIANRLGVKQIGIIQKYMNSSDISNLLDGYYSVLIIDDINDTGKTLDKFMFINTKNAYSVGTLFSRYTTKWPNVLCGHELKHDDWLLFPWEVLDK
jgi:hypoxanthine phosphoribosyltransferase